MQVDGPGEKLCKWNIRFVQQFAGCTGLIFNSLNASKLKKVLMVGCGQMGRPGLESRLIGGGVAHSPEEGVSECSHYSLCSHRRALKATVNIPWTKTVVSHMEEQV